MTYTLVATTLIFAGLLGYVLRQSHTQLSAHRAEVKALVDQIVLLKVEPQMAAVQAVPIEVTDTPHLSPFDDMAVAKYEQERERLQSDTDAFIRSAS